MITKENFKQVLEYLGFTNADSADKNSEIWSHTINNHALSVVFYMDTNGKVIGGKLIYNANEKAAAIIKINDETTSNFSHNENFVVFECVCRLLAKGYKAESLELEPKWLVGRGAKGGKADILVRDMQGDYYLLIECKTATASSKTNASKTKSEFEKEWANMLRNGGQLFSYYQQIPTTKYLCLYTSDFVESNEIKNITYQNYIIAMIDNKDELAKLKDGDPLKNGYKGKHDVSRAYEVWQKVYAGENWDSGIFEEVIPAYKIKKQKRTLSDLIPIENHNQIKKQQYIWATILRANAIGERAHALKILINLLLCKITDEILVEKGEKDDKDLRFVWGGYASDSAFDLVDRLQYLYFKGMKEQLKEEIIYHSLESINQAFKNTNKKNPAKDSVANILNDYKFFSNGDFNFLEVNNLTRFNKNFKVLLSVVQSLENLKLNDKGNAQMLGDFYEQIIKDSPQTEGQYFTPTPLVAFIISSLPHFKDSRVLDFSCGAGHFLSEFVRINGYENTKITAIDKDERLAKMASVSALMHGSKDIQRTYSLDSLLVDSRDESRPALKDNSFNVIISNPPYAVDNFLDNLADDTKQGYEIYNTTQNDSTDAIECYFIEKASKVLKSYGLLSLVLPSSLLNKTDSIFTKTREILLRDFYIIALCEFGNQTFWKTGTQPIILFAIRKDKDDKNTTDTKIYDFYYENIIKGDLEAIKENYSENFTKMLKLYCEFRGFDIAEFKSLLSETLQETSSLFENESFKEYKRDYDKLYNAQLRDYNEKLAKKKKEFFMLKKYKALTQEKKEQLYNEHKEANPFIPNPSLTSYIKQKEAEKFLFYCYCYDSTPLIIKAPQDNQAQKRFLGYFWSNTKGSEGIHYNPINHINATDAFMWIDTPLFNPRDDYEVPKGRFDKTKLSFFILYNFIVHYKNLDKELKNENLKNTPMNLINKEFLKEFLEKCGIAIDEITSDFPKEIFEMPNQYVFKARLADLLDFEKAEFNKAISLNPKGNDGTGAVNPFLNSKFELVAFSSVTKSEGKGKRPASFATKNGTYPFIKSSKTIEKCDEFDFDTEALIIGDGGGANIHYINGRFASSDHTYIFTKSGDTSLKFLYFLINSNLEILEAGFKGIALKNISKSFISNMQIPLPPLEIQKQIVEECEIVESQYQKIRMSIEEYQKLIKAVLVKCGIIVDSNALDSIGGGGIDAFIESILNALESLALEILELSLKPLKFIESACHTERSEVSIKEFSQVDFSLNAQSKASLENDKVQNVESQNADSTFTTLKALLDSIPTPPKEGWDFVKLGEITSIQSGGTPSREVAEYWGGDINWIKSEVCQNCYVYENQVKEKITELGFKKSSAKMLKKDSVLIALVGATIGKVGYLTFESSTNQNIAGLYPLNLSQLNSKFLYYACLGLYPHFEALTSFTMANLTFIKNLKIPLPPLKAQEKIINALEFVEGEIVKVESTLKDLESKKSEILTNALSDGQQEREREREREITPK